MGGIGSGNFYDWQKKETVEESYILNTNSFVHKRLLRESNHTYGNWSWYYIYTGKQALSIGYEIDTLDLDYPWIRLHYSISGEYGQLDYKVRLTTTRPNFGGLRWWFLCPIIVNGRTCNRRVGKIYLPPSGRYFGCRNCHDLTYRSCQESDKRVNWLRRNPEVLEAMLDNSKEFSFSDRLRAIKAGMLNEKVKANRS